MSHQKILQFKRQIIEKCNLGEHLVFFRLYRILCYPSKRADDNIILWAYVDVNSVQGPGFAQAENYNSLSINVMAKLDMYESVNVMIRAGQTTSHSDANHFQIQKIV